MYDKAQVTRMLPRNAKDLRQFGEQQLIKKNGGAKSEGGTSGNEINGVSPKNPKKQHYENAANKEF